MPLSSWSFQNIRNRMTVRLQVALVTAVTCSAAVGIAAVGAAVVAKNSAQANANQQLKTLARTMADRLDQHMFERYREIQNIASLSPLQNVWSKDGAATRTILEKLQASLPEYAWLGFATPDGMVHAATKGMLEGVSVAQRPWFVDGLKQPTVEDVHDAKLLEKLLRTSPDEAPFRFVDVAMPVFDEHQVLAGVLGAHMSWTWADAVRRTVLTTQDTANAAELWVSARDGSLLIGPADHKLDVVLLTDAAKSDGVLFTDDTSSAPMLSAMVATRGQGSYPGLGWAVVARMPVAMIYAPAHQLVLQILLIGGIVAVFASAVAWFLAGSVTNPLKALAISLDLIGRQANVTSVERQHGSLDILRLSAAVRSLLRRVGSAEASEQNANSTIDTLQREVEDQKRDVEQKMLRYGADLHALQKLADTDSLTGLLNRRAFLPFAEDAWNYYRRYGRAFSILMFDIDHFKRINDTFGHAAGDEVIREMGKIISSGIRATDKVARFGGEEFVVLLRETDEAAALLMANRLREKIASTIVTAGEHRISFSTSVGCALGSSSARDLEDVIQLADTALYVAKTSGRNRVAMDGVTAEGRRAAA
ncbi:GGDEF domain-containing protein [Neorhizobium lilium]|uniref:diguanylate cyclase n=1 Tax=Neorhizobium lilium TaxID=2503024 RepID=A0A444LB35_9HYPH|nr:sensor domain-containing diguanylate cyclase [Neorhizobium lilium]RWX74797.1 GGDEF domain-containing protein [Neorhizobium lilium]